MVPAPPVALPLHEIPFGHKPRKHLVTVKAKQPNQNRSALEPTESAKAQPPAKKTYRKPALKRLGLLKAVAGSGLWW